MKFKLKSLNYFIKDKLDYRTIVKTLTEIGLEVENEDESTEDLTNFKIAQILEFEKHPNADRLNVCKVFDGNGTFQIVCGANNLFKGMKTILALPDAVIPNGNFKIKKSKIRDIESFGMLCSKKELGIEDESSGIINLDSNVNFQDDITYLLNLEREIEVNVTPNRGYALSIYGLAKDLSAALNLELKENIDNFKFNHSIENNIEVKINTDKDVSYFYLKLENLKNFNTPDEIKEVIKTFGMKETNSIVDVLNYVMILYGQPMHAYDSDKIDENLIEIKNENLSNFKALNNNLYSLANCLTINDNKKEIAIAGIIGSEETKITNETKNITIEAAYFMPEVISKNSQLLNIKSDASKKFERGIDYNLIEFSLKKAVSLILENSENVLISEIKNKANFKYKAKEINYNINEIEKTFGQKISKVEQVKILKNLDFEVKEIDDNNLILKAPSFRNSVNNSYEVCEEIGRILNYNKIISDSKPQYLNYKKSKNNLYENILELKKINASLNYVEIISLPFLKSQEINELLKINNEENLSSIEITNPLKEEERFLQNSLIVNLLKAFVKNYNLYKFDKVKFFEIANTFHLNQDKQKIEIIRLGSLFFDKNLTFEESVEKIKQDLFNNLLYFTNLKSYQFQIKIENNAYNIYYKDLYVGKFSEINYKLKNLFKIDEKKIILFSEILVDNLILLKQKINKKNPDQMEEVNQVMHREFAFIFDLDFDIRKISEIIEKFKKIRNFEIKDVFKIDENKKSVAFKIEIHSNNILNSEEIDLEFSNPIIEKINNIGGILRDGISAK